MNNKRIADLKNLKSLRALNFASNKSAAPLGPADKVIKFLQINREDLDSVTLFVDSTPTLKSCFEAASATVPTAVAEIGAFIAKNVKNELFMKTFAEELDKAELV